ncbi:ATP-binding protein [Clostridium estertheticum]|uniref:AAA family ATPase n=1 Tax=Clostridium estertheticum TaxID=238834 RepID=UPI0013E968CE|nr:AAA family ATPase [Clostridium estertheticum]MBZ9687429.1 ATP-binding protein [Clostridium estertheticum]
MFLLQMAGFPGSGKSTLAKEISKYIDVVVIDRDVIKSSMIESGVALNIVANASYNVVFSLCKYYLSLNKNVIIDTPCYYNDSLDNGISIAHEYNAEYKFIECRVEDFEVVNNRLRSRKRSISQIEAAEKNRFLGAIDKSKRPTKTNYLVVDSSLKIESYIEKALNYIELRGDFYEIR